MKRLKDNIGLNLISFYGYNAPNDNKRNSFVNDKSYTLFYDRQTKGVFKAETKNISTPKFLLLFLIGYPTMNIFPNDVIPYHHKLIFFSLCFMTLVLSMIVGNYFVLGLNKGLRRITLSQEEWKYYLEKGNKLYFIQIIFMTSLLLFAITCFILLYIYQSKWWLFGGIGASFIVGGGITIFTRTRYLLYKEKIGVNLNNGRK